MHKLLEIYKSNPNNTEAARKLTAYIKKHPMSEVLASPEDCGWIRQAKTQSF